MNIILKHIRDWLEVWALFIPLIVILVKGKQLRGMTPIVAYVIIALIINSAATVLYVFNRSLPDFLKNNNILYNLHSVARVAFFSWFIIQIRAHRNILPYKILLAAYAVFVICNFAFIESPLFFSTRLFTAESVILLLLCLSFFIRSMQDDSQVNWLKHPAFLICTGICLYEGINFFIFLFFYPLAEQNPGFGKATMTIHHIMFAFMCVMLAFGMNNSTVKEVGVRN